MSEPSNLASVPPFEAELARISGMFAEDVKAEPTVGQALRWIRKLEALDSDAAKLIYFSHIVKTVRRMQS